MCSDSVAMFASGNRGLETRKFDCSERTKSSLSAGRCRVYDSRQQIRQQKFTVGRNKRLL